MPTIYPAAGGSGGGAPSGAAGGDLAGTYPNPTVTDLTITSEARGDALVRGASAWRRLAAQTSGSVLAGDGTDVVSQPIATTLAVAPTANLAALSLGLADTGSAVHRWQLGEGAGTSFADSGSAAQALTLTGAEARVTAPGIRGSGVYFDGSANNYLRTIDSPAVPGAQSFTVHGWVKLATYVGTYQQFCNKPVDPATWLAPYVGVGIGLTNSSTGAWSVQTSAGGVFSQFVMTDDQWLLRPGGWHHLAASYDGTTVRAYLDGVLAGSAAAAGDVTWGTGPWQLGGSLNSASSWSLGTLSDWRVEGSVLTAAQLAAVYERGVRQFL